MNNTLVVKPVVKPVSYGAVCVSCGYESLAMNMVNGKCSNCA